MGIAVIFPGQGTQTTGMGAPWRDHPAWGVVDRAETALGEPLSSLVLDAPTEQLARTREAQLSSATSGSDTLGGSGSRFWTTTTSGFLPSWPDSEP